MLLELVKLAQTLENELPPRLYSKSKVNFLIDLDADGNFIVPIVQIDQDQLVPHLGRNGDKAKLLVDTAEYVLGLGDRGSRRFPLFVELVKRCADDTQEPSVKAVVNFLDKLPLIEHENLTPGSVIGFQIKYKDLKFEKPHDLPSVREFWASLFEASSQGSQKQHCLVTGKNCIPETKVQAKIKGVPNTQGSGASLTSAFLESTYSYGLQQALVAPMSPATVEAYTQALNHLLKSKEHCLRVGGVAYLLWHPDGGNELDVLNFLDKPSLEDAQRWFEADRKPSQYRSEIDDTVYVLGLTGASGRIVVRDWLTRKMPEVQEAVKEWLANQRLMDFQGKWRKPLGVWQLASAAYLKGEDILERHLIALTRNVLLGNKSPIPRDLLLRCLERIRAEQQPSYQQSVLIRLFLCSEGLCKQMSEIKDPGEYLDDFATDELKSAYCLGRLLAIYHEIQSRAQSWRTDTNATRRYATASVSPIQVFPQLDRMVLHHLESLEKSQGYFEHLISEVRIAMPNKQYSRRLTPEEQAAFGQGFWIQRHQPKRNSNTDATTTKTQEV